MKKVGLAQATTYTAPLHFDCRTMRLHGKAETGNQKFWVGLTYFLPGGGIEFGGEDSPADKVYMCLDGEVVITNKDGQEFNLGPMDSLYIAPNEGRSLKNKGTKTAAMLVVANY